MICGELNQRRPPAMRRLGGGDATWPKAVSSSARHNGRPQLVPAPSLPVALPPLRPGAVPPPPSKEIIKIVYSRTMQPFHLF